MTEVEIQNSHSLIEQYEKHKKIMREYQRNRIKNNPEYYEKQKEIVKNYMNNKYKTDEEYRKKVSEKARQRYQKKKEARLLEMEKLIQKQQEE